ncbi:hypothetical protein BD310DRAFT_909689 [Dichomitus squalens]|uniref:Uncharacterized protein n=1 Tax=Dichomitus squalens TaxID=114155 RepID=A0A4V2K6Q6_9APHY|nr:hypothetical protein BD310DRAFT_909689 [Dichomitus squalens]
MCSLCSKHSTQHGHTVLLKSILDPSQKNLHLKRCWDDELYMSVIQRAEDIYWEQYNEMYLSASSANQSSVKKTATTGSATCTSQLQQLFGKLSDNKLGDNGSVEPVSTMLSATPEVDGKE